MTTMTMLGVLWALVTIAYAVLIMYRSRLLRRESDWIPLTDDEHESQAIQAQTILEMKTQKLAIPIWALGTLSVVLLLAVIGYWVYRGFVTPPPMPE